MQSIGGREYSGALDVFRTTFREEGMRGLYKGVGANLLKVVPTIALMFYSKETLINIFDAVEEQTGWGGN